MTIVVSLVASVALAEAVTMVVKSLPKWASASTTTTRVVFHEQPQLLE